MKDDEIKFFLTVARYGKQLANRNTYWTTGIEIRVVINFLSEFIHHKRCWYLLQKWAKLGFYNYGVTLDLGWLELDKLPERYRVLLPEDFNIYGCKEIT